MKGPAQTPGRLVCEVVTVSCDSEHEPPHAGRSKCRKQGLLKLKPIYLKEEKQIQPSTEKREHSVFKRVWNRIAKEL